MTNEDVDIAARRAGIRRTVWILSFVAFAIFVAFCLDQMLRS